MKQAVKKILLNVLISATTVIVTLALVACIQVAPTINVPEGTSKLDYLKALLEAMYNYHLEAVEYAA